MSPRTCGDRAANAGRGDPVKLRGVRRADGRRPRHPGATGRPSEPVVALDERPAARPGRPASPGRMARQDYEYVRRGTANIFCIVEPKAGCHLTYATPNCTAKQFARALRRIAQRYRSARTIHLVMDNLNTHRKTRCARPSAVLRGASSGAALRGSVAGSGRDLEKLYGLSCPRFAEPEAAPHCARACRPNPD
ncbi:transposase [Nannocystis bainbridge]|uniref:transposase n=1 Tax=Nannocystis bainbridge TaxID=2995303 RepID=UPI00358DB582